MNFPFKHIKAEDISGNVFKMIGREGVIISAGSIEKYNMMTASWGTMGMLWNREIFMCFIRPGRYTYEFIEKYSFFTVNFFDPDKKGFLEYCGTHSGREVNKMIESGLTPGRTESGAVFFEEARLVLECKKIYYDDLEPLHFLYKFIDDNYELKDYHRLYIGEIINCLLR